MDIREKIEELEDKTEAAVISYLQTEGWTEVKKVQALNHEVVDDNGDLVCWLSEGDWPIFYKHWFEKDGESLTLTWVWSPITEQISLKKIS